MNPTRLTEIPVVFYRTARGTEPVLDWLRRLPAEDRRAIGADLARCNLAGRLGCRSVDPSGTACGEVRSLLPSRRIARLLFFIEGNRIGVVHGFIEKTQKTPVDELALARRRMKEMQA